MKWVIQNEVGAKTVPVHKQTVLIYTAFQVIQFGFYDRDNEKWYYLQRGEIKEMTDSVIKWAYRPTKEELEKKELEKTKEITPVERAMNIMTEMDKLSNQCASNLDFDKSRKVARAFTYMSKIFIREIITLARGGK